MDKYKTLSNTYAQEWWAAMRQQRWSYIPVILNNNGSGVFGRWFRCQGTDPWKLRMAVSINGGTPLKWLVDNKENPI